MNSITPISKLPLYFRLKKYLLMGLIFATIAIYIFFILNFASKMNNEASSAGAHNKPPTGEQAFKPLTNTYNVSVSNILSLSLSLSLSLKLKKRSGTYPKMFP